MDNLLDCELFSCVVTSVDDIWTLVRLRKGIIGVTQEHDGYRWKV